MLRIDQLTHTYANGTRALDGVDLSIPPGMFGLLGPNGAGKSTLLKTLAGLIPKESGRISFHGHVVHGPTHDLAYLPQREQIDWDFPTTVRGIVEMGRYLRLGWWRRYSARDEEAVVSAIKAMHLEQLEDRQINALSGGQQQRAFLARALAQEAHVVLLDEPFTGLDKPTQENLKSVVRELREAGKLILASHHDLGTVAQIFDQVIMLNGELVAAGPTAETMTEENLRRTYSAPVFSRVTHGLAH